jgi:hypothetical protein
MVLPVSHQSFELELPLREARDAFERAYFRVSSDPTAL